MFLLSKILVNFIYAASYIASIIIGLILVLLGFGALEGIGEVVSISFGKVNACTDVLYGVVFGLVTSLGRAMAEAVDIVMTVCLNGFASALYFTASRTINTGVFTGLFTS